MVAPSLSENDLKAALVEVLQERGDLREEVFRLLDVPD